MGEVTVLILVIIQIILVCCCVYIIKSYCSVPLRIVRRLLRSCLSDSEDEENQKNENTKQTLTQQQQQPYPPLQQAYPSQQQIPMIYAPNSMPPPNFQQYPMHQPQFPMPSYPTRGNYPHEMGFIAVSPSLQTLSSSACSLETNLSEEPSKKNTTCSAQNIQN